MIEWVDYDAYVADDEKLPSRHANDRLHLTVRVNTAPIPAKRAEQPGTGIAQAPKREFDWNYWEAMQGRNRYEWPPLDEAAYIVRFRRLSFRYHPAVAAIMAHDPVTGDGCKERRQRRIPK